MIKYFSTRGDKKLFTFSEVILKGIASDGGLFVPARFPKLSIGDLKLLIGKSYQEIAFYIFNLFETNFNKVLLEKIINQAYSSNFDTPKIAPLVHLADNQYILELWHGPTSAFKDIALQIMPFLFSEAAKKTPYKYLILVATSGDTGTAALEGYKNKEKISIIVFYPESGISKLQELSMTTQEGNNLEVISMKGDFDAIQKSVKETFNDKKFNRLLKEKYNIILSSANSINWGRLLPQIVYHVKAYLDLVNRDIINLGDEIDVAVPTGNFGNILAAFYDKKMGLPVRKLMCASNENNVLTEFLQTGVYDVSNRNLIKTPSPAMDIIIASNIERLLFEITKDPKIVSQWMNQLKNDEKFSVDNRTKKILQSIFYADWVSNRDCLSTIKKIFNETNYLMDPHTAVAQTVVDVYQKKYTSDIPVVICSTAHWAKFPSDTYKALTGINSDSDEFKVIDEIIQLIPRATILKNILELKSRGIRHAGKCNIGKDEIERIILETIKNLFREY